MRMDVLSICLLLLLALVQSETPAEEESKQVSKAQPRFSWLVTTLIGAALSGGATVAVEEIIHFHSGTESNECRISIKYSENKGRSGVKMNFKTDLRSNWNEERLDDVGSGLYVDSTKERVDGGRLKLIQFWWSGKACITDVAFSCGSEVTGNGDKSVLVGPIDFGIRDQYNKTIFAIIELW